MSIVPVNTTNVVSSDKPSSQQSSFSDEDCISEISNIITPANNETGDKCQNDSEEFKEIVSVHSTSPIKHIEKTSQSHVEDSTCSPEINMIAESASEIKCVSKSTSDLNQGMNETLNAIEAPETDGAEETAESTSEFNSEMDEVVSYLSATINVPLGYGYVLNSCDATWLEPLNCTDQLLSSVASNENIEPLSLESSSELIQLKNIENLPIEIPDFAPLRSIENLEVTSTQLAPLRNIENLQPESSDSRNLLLNKDLTVDGDMQIFVENDDMVESGTIDSIIDRLTSPKKKTQPALIDVQDVQSLRKRAKITTYQHFYEPEDCWDTSDEYIPSNSSSSSSSEENVACSGVEDNQTAPLLQNSTSIVGTPEDEQKQKDFIDTLETQDADENSAPRQSTPEKKNKEVDRTEASTDATVSVIPPEKSSNIAQNGIVVASLKGKRTWDKRFPCTFCTKTFAKLPRHWYKAHSDEVEVAKITSLKKDSEERKILIDELRNRGTFTYNASLIRGGSGAVLPKRRPVESQQRRLEDYLPCQFCRQLFSKNHIAVHQGRCKAKEVLSLDENQTKRNRGIRAANVLMLPVGPVVSSRFKKAILAKMSGDEIFMAIRKDSVILRYGEHEYGRLQHEERYYRTIMDRLRELGRVVIAAREIDPSANSISCLLRASRYQLLKSAVKKVAGFDDELNTFKTPSLVLKLGISLKKCAMVLKGDYLEDDVLRAAVPDIDGFLQVMDAKWSAEMATHAHRTLQERKWNVPKRLPIAKDIQKLTKYLSSKSKELLEKLDKSSDSKVFSELTEITLVQTLTLNRRRVGEVQFMKLEEYDKAQGTDIEADVFQTLSDAEKQLSSKLIRLVIKGKKGRGVPVLLTKTLQESISLLISKREECGVSKSSLYLFPSLHHSSGHYRAHVLLKKFAVLSECDFPNHITSTKLRKHVATMTQLLNLPEHELDALAKFMGHDIRVHREYYRLADETMDLAKVSKLLLNMEQGKLNSLKGKSFNEIHVNDEELSEEDDTPDDDDAEQLPTKSGGEVSVPSSSRSEDSVPSSSRSELHGHDDYHSSPQSGTDSDSSEAPVHKKRKLPPKKNVQKKQPWSKEEAELVRKHFSAFVASLMAPKKGDVEEFLQKYPNVFHNRTWRNIKDYVYNMIKVKKGRK